MSPIISALTGPGRRYEGVEILIALTVPAVREQLSNFVRRLEAETTTKKNGGIEIH
jgi:hypothetical protein